MDKKFEEHIIKNLSICKELLNLHNKDNSIKTIALLFYTFGKTDKMLEGMYDMSSTVKKILNRDDVKIHHHTTPQRVIKVHDALVNWTHSGNKILLLDSKAHLKNKDLIDFVRKEAGYSTYTSSIDIWGIIYKVINKYKLQ